MAGEWLKFECCLPEKPETLAITVAMGWDDPDLTVGKLMRVFRWFDQHTTNGNAFGVTPALLDRLIGVTGFVHAMANVGWVAVSHDGLALKNFDKHNGTSAKSRSQTAKRVASHRASSESNGQCNADTVTPALAREEKRREEKRNTSEAKASGAESAKPQRVTDPDEIIFGYGVPLLVSAGSEEKHARSFLGKLRKDHGDTRVVDALRECVKTKPLQPLEWLAGALPPKGKSAMNRQEAIEADGKRVAAEWLAEQRGVA